MQKLENPRQERARVALSQEQLTKDERAKIAVHLQRFVAALEHQRRFDAAVASSLERLAANPVFRQRLLALDSQFRMRIYK
jgi:hypothetical protein